MTSIQGHQSPYRLVVVGASAGGVETLRTFVSGLPEDLAAPVVVVLHVPPSGTSALPNILGRVARLPVAHIVDGDAMEDGRIYVAPPDRHAVVVDGRLMLSAGPRENGHRPAVDVLFRSAARYYGDRAIAIVLSGGLDDGTAGLVAVRSRGGEGIVQLPAEALHPAMPMNAIEATKGSHVVPVASMPALLQRLLDRPPSTEPTPAPPVLTWETQMSQLEPEAMHGSRPATPSGLSCPDCHGVLFEIESDPPRYRCRVGHAWSMTSLSAEHNLAVDDALWTALRSLEERAALAETMGNRLEGRGNPRAKKYQAKRDESLKAAEALRTLLASMSAATVDEIDFDDGDEVEDAGDSEQAGA